MKLNTAFNILLAVICTVSRAHARVPSRLRDPRTVEEKEQVHRQTMGDYVTSSLLSTKLTDGSSCQEHLEAKEAELKNDADLSPEQAKSLACTAVSNEYKLCHGCQGFSQVDKEVHIPGCVGMTYEGCIVLAGDIVKDKPDWFKEGGGTILKPEELNVDLPSAMAYYKLGLPVSADDDHVQGSKVVTGVAGDCMVHYPWDWCVDSEGSTVCLKLPPWDCSGGVDSGCLSSSECCGQILGEYPGQDINGNELLCYEWVLPAKSSVSSGENTSGVVSNEGSSVVSGIGSSGGVTGNRLIIHLNEGKVAVPAVITDGNYKVENAEEIIEVCTPERMFPNDLNTNGEPVTLKNAVAKYAEQGCANNPDCLIVEQYGWPINTWCVEKVTSFYNLFRNLSTFNEDINGWTTSQVTTMESVFQYAKTFNQPLNNWDVSSVTNMQSVLSGAAAFNQPLNNWKVSSVTTMSSMFNGASAFNQPLNNWALALTSVTYMRSMFSRARAFNQPLDNWDVSSTTDMWGMFLNARAFNQPLNNWKVSSVTNMFGMFQNAAAFNQPLNSWDVSRVTSMEQMFYAASAFNQPLPWNVSRVTTMKKCSQTQSISAQTFAIFRSTIAVEKYMPTCFMAPLATIREILHLEMGPGAILIRLVKIVGFARRLSIG